ncbi:MAG TPA: CHRD domain-containing protein [Candidatus Aquicultoraceae bacterium]|nr:CHRD domain-containing protein [Candidatus Aquicultoraceae bacterium]
MRKILLFSLLALVAAAFAAPGTSSAEEKKEKAGKMDEGKTYVKLSPFPKVKSKGEGKATFELSGDGSSLHYKLAVEKMNDVTMAHVHATGPGGVPGPILVWLYPTSGQAPSLKEGKVSGMLAEGDITADKIGGPMKGKSVKELYDAIDQGKAGVAVHTKANPKVELWGTNGEHGKGMMEHKESGGEKKERKSGY